MSSLVGRQLITAIWKGNVGSVQSLADEKTLEYEDDEVRVLKNDSLHITRMIDVLMYFMI